MEEKKKKRVYGEAEAFLKAQAWCAYQERSQQEMRDKLYDWGLHREQVEHMLSELIGAGFLNEERFARAFAGGKFRIKKWGKIKIRQALKLKQVSDVCIRKGMEEIPASDYRRTLQKLAAEKWRSVKEKHPLKKKYKVMQYLIGKGYEQDLVRDAVNSEAGDE